MEWQEAVKYLFGFMAMSIAGWVAKSMSDLKNSADQIHTSVEELNIKIAVVISRTDNHEQRLNRLEDKK